MNGLLVFTVTTHRHLDGARLSLAGQWGNLPHPCEDTAAQAARDLAKGRAYHIERKGLP